jgi:hypothetical protein
MNVEQMYEALSYGELSNLALSGEGSGLILDEKKPQVLLALNEGLLRLHTKFVLREKEVIIEMVRHITNYHLLARFAHYTTPVVERWTYIRDMPNDRFVEDVLKVTGAYNTYGQALPLNDSEQDLSIFTPQLNMVQIPRPVHGSAVSLLYQARHAELLLDTPEQDILVPDSLMGALRAYLAYKIYSQLGTQEATVKAVEHMNTYEAICNEVETHGMTLGNPSTTNVRFDKRGWI